MQSWPAWLRPLAAAADVEEIALGPIAARADEARPHLLAALRAAPHNGDALAPARAAWAIGRLGWEEATPELIGALGRAAEGEPLWRAAVDALVALGVEVALPVLNAARASEDPALRRGCADVLLRLGVRDPEVLALLHRLLGEDPDTAAAALVAYGDPDALFALHRALQEAPDPVTVPAAKTVRELAWAVEALGGTLTPRESAKAFRASAWLGARRERLRG